MKKIKVRAPRRKEFVQIRDCHSKSIRHLCAKDYNDEQIEAWAGRKKPRHYKNGFLRDEQLLVAVRDNRVLGVGSLVLDEIVLLYVHPDCGGNGVGRALLDALESKAKKRNVGSIRLLSTLTAVPFYEKHGFRTGEQASIRLRGIAIPCVSMKKEIPT